MGEGHPAPHKGRGEQRERTKWGGRAPSGHGEARTEEGREEGGWEGDRAGGAGFAGAARPLLT